MDFRNKRVLITGGGRGIGRATAAAFAERGARVVIGYQSDEGSADATLNALAGEGHAKVAADVADPVGAERLVSAAVEHLGGLDVLVNSAGIAMAHPLDRVDYESWCAAWQRILGVNLLGPANTCFHAARHMIAGGGGRIVNVSSRGVSPAATE